MKTVCSSVASSPDESEVNILVWNDQFYSENAFGHKFQCLQLFIGFSKQFIDFPDIGKVKKSIFLNLGKIDFISALEIWAEKTYVHF